MDKEDLLIKWALWLVIAGGSLTLLLGWLRLAGVFPFGWLWLLIPVFVSLLFLALVGGYLAAHSSLDDVSK